MYVILDEVEGEALRSKVYRYAAEVALHRLTSTYGALMGLASAQPVDGPHHAPLYARLTALSELIGEIRTYSPHDAADVAATELRSFVSRLESDPHAQFEQQKETENGE
jgi:hypothetical protein